MSVVPELAVGDCSTVPGNLITNCNFATNISNWNQVVGTFSSNGAMGSTAPPSMQIVSAFDGVLFSDFTRTNQCIPVVGNINYGYGIDHKLTVDGTVFGPTCSVQIQEHDAASCANQVGSLIQTAFSPGTTFAQSPSANLTTQAATVSVVFTVICEGDITILLDDAFFGAGLVPVELQQFSVD